MWTLKNRTPYAAASIWGRDRDGQHQWIVAVKACYHIGSNGDLRLADEQLPPLLAAEYFGEPGQSSLRYDADLVPPKPTTDIVLNGTAYAPGAVPSREFLVSLRLDTLRKVLRVRGNRHWEAGLLGLKPTPEDPVEQLPIRYERAWGGYDRHDPNPKHQAWDGRNPVGRGVVARDSRREGTPLHNFEYLDGEPHKTGPAGFGALDSFWSPRREFAGTYDQAWQKNRHPLLPLDWDARCLQCAPVDQQPRQPLRGGEPLELVNLTPSGRLELQLPRVYLAFSTQIDGRREEHRGQLASVIIEPDQARLILVWTTTLLCRNNGAYLDYTLIREKRYP